MVERLILKMCKEDLKINGAKVLVLGLTFKENCPDLRNTKVYEIIKSLEKYGMNPTIVDPIASIEDAREIYHLEIKNKVPIEESFEVVILTVAHNEYKKMSASNWRELGNSECIYVDFKGLIPREINALRL